MKVPFFIKWKLYKHCFNYEQTLLCIIFGMILWWWDKKYGLRFFSLLPMKNAANVLHQQQHSIELASAISKIRLHFPMHTQCIAVLVTASCSCSVHTVVRYEFTGYQIKILLLSCLFVSRVSIWCVPCGSLSFCLTIIAVFVEFPG